MDNKSVRFSERGLEAMLKQACDGVRLVGENALPAIMVLCMSLSACSKPEQELALAGVAADEPGLAPAPQTGEPAIADPGLSAQASSNRPEADAGLDSSGWTLPPPFYAAGDEPFWRLDLVDGWFVFKRSGLPEIETPVVAPDQQGGVDVFKAAPLTISIRRAACAAEGGEQGDAVALVVLDDIEFSGCAFSGQSASGSAEAAAVIEALPAIDACLQKLGEPALVTGIYPREGGRTALGLRVKNGSLYECAAEAGGSVIAFLDPIEPGAAGAWMTSRMRFQRSGGGPDAPCADAEDVMAGETLVGRLLTSKCKFG